jgi:uncharacterized phage protein (TIGR01671 family)
MSREIKFRAKSLKTNEFVFGFFCQRTETSPVRETTQTYTINYILVDNGFCGFEEIEIDIKTLGQWTGLLDKNGIKIFEGDVVHISGIGNYEITDICQDFDMLVNAIVEGDLNEIVGNIYKNKELITGVKNG